MGSFSRYKSLAQIYGILHVAVSAAEIGADAGAIATRSFAGQEIKQVVANVSADPRWKDIRSMIDYVASFWVRATSHNEVMEKIKATKSRSDVKQKAYRNIVSLASTKVVWGKVLYGEDAICNLINIAFCQMPVPTEELNWKDILDKLSGVNVDRFAAMYQGVKCWYLARVYVLAHSAGYEPPGLRKLLATSSKKIRGLISWIGGAGYKHGDLVCALNHTCLIPEIVRIVYAYSVITTWPEVTRLIAEEYFD